MNRESDDRVAMFWGWFVEHVDEIGAGGRLAAEDGGLPPVLAELDARVAELGFGGSWEIGPEGTGWFFCVSPGSSSERLVQTTEFVARAPSVRGWVFHPAKPPKVWDNRVFTFDGHDVDANLWRYKLRRWDDGAMGIIWGLPEQQEITGDDLEELGWMMLASELGEAVVIRRFVDLEVIVRPPWLAESNHVSTLREHVEHLTSDAGDA